jgi:amino acid adenylation domain-containing protein
MTGLPDPARVPFTLPTAWRGATDPTRAEVPYGDLTVSLTALARAAGEDIAAILLTAHLTALGAIGAEPGCITSVRGLADDGETRAVPIVDDGGPTWQHVVRAVGLSVRAADPDVDAGRPAFPDRTLFVAGPAAAPVGASHGFGLMAVAADDALTLCGAPGAVAAPRLVSLATIYRSVLEAMAADHDGAARGAFLPAAERHTVLDEWGTGASVGYRGHTVVDLIRDQMVRVPEAIAVRWSGGVLTYQELDRRANQIARHLSGLGAGPELLVGVCLRRTGDLLPALLGVWRSGAGQVPLDPDLPPERLRHMARAAGCTLLITIAEHAGLFDDGAGRLVMLDRDAGAIAAQAGAPVDTTVGPAHIAYIIYTSGSTGSPKGVIVHHAALVNHLAWTAEAFAAHGTGGSAMFSSISVDLGIPSLYTPLITGQPVHLLPESLRTADLGATLLDGAPYSFIKMTPGHLDLVSLDLFPDEVQGLAGLVIAAGDAFPTSLAARWMAAAGPGGTLLATEYGPTEVAIGSSSQVVTDLPGTDLIPLGNPIPNTTTYVLTRRLDPAPIGVPGEIYVGGAGVTRGYLNAPGLTAERFVADPYGAAGARLYRTGDRGRWRPDGTLEFLGRVDHQVKIRGFRVELGEIRGQLLRHPGIAEAVIVACGPAPLQQRLVAFVVPAPLPDGGTPAGRAELRDHLAAELPDHMIPAQYVTVDKFPLTPNGKVDTRALQKLL